MSRVVIGIGNPFRRDDAAGLEVARRIRAIPAHATASDAFDLIEMWGNADDVVIVDAMHSGAPAGTVRTFEVDDTALPRGFMASTHSAGIRDAVEVARRLGRLPAHVVVYGIEAGNVKPGFQMTPAVRRAVSRVVKEIDHA
jgi:hydrogenase maturation protease